VSLMAQAGASSAGGSPDPGFALTPFATQLPLWIRIPHKGQRPAPTGHIEE